MGPLNGATLLTQMKASRDNMAFEPCFAAGAFEHLCKILIETLQLVDVHASVFPAL